MSVKFYVGNLSSNTSSRDLSDLFGSVGSVTSCSILADGETGRSRGFGFVEMASKAEGENAIAQLNGHEIDGRELKIAKAKPLESRNSGGRGGYKGGVNDHAGLSGHVYMN